MLNDCIIVLIFLLEVVVGGVVVLMEEVVVIKILGEEDRYSCIDLWDFDVNFEGVEKIYILLCLLVEIDVVFVGKVDGNFVVVYEVLVKYQMFEGGYVLYEKLIDVDCNVFLVKVNMLVEDLVILCGKLGLS